MDFVWYEVFDLVDCMVDMYIKMLCVKLCVIDFECDLICMYCGMGYLL